MNKISQNMRQLVGFLTVICGGLIVGLPAIAQQSPSLARVNPCPSIYYEEPHNNQAFVPANCPANAFTKRMNAQGYTRDNLSSSPTEAQIRLGVGGEAPNSSDRVSQGFDYSEFIRIPQTSSNDSRPQTMRGYEENGALVVPRQPSTANSDAQQSRHNASGIGGERTATRATQQDSQAVSPSPTQSDDADGADQQSMPQMNNASGIGGERTATRATQQDSQAVSTGVNASSRTRQQSMQRMENAAGIGGERTATRWANTR